MTGSTEPRKAAARAALAWLRATWPKSVGEFLPLALGVHKDAIAVAAGLHSPRAIRDAMHYHANSPRYREALSRPGAMRVNLDGEHVEPVSPEHRANASGARSEAT